MQLNETSLLIEYTQENNYLLLSEIIILLILFLYLIIKNKIQNAIRNQTQV